MKKIISIIAILILVSSFMTACFSGPKDTDYLYGWLSEHGTLVDGTCLQYSGTDKNGTKFSLCYDTSYVEKLRWHVHYSTKDTSGRTIITTLFLFNDSDKSLAHISVYGSGAFDDYYRTLEYFHNPAIFTINSPIEHGELDGSTVHVPDSGEALIKEILTLNDICEDRAQKSLCLILDWLKNSFCTTAKMSMSDFGYDNY